MAENKSRNFLEEVKNEYSEMENRESKLRAERVEKLIDFRKRAHAYYIEDKKVKSLTKLSSDYSKFSESGSSDHSRFLEVASKLTKNPSEVVGEEIHFMMDYEDKIKRYEKERGIGPGNTRFADIVDGLSGRNKK